MSSQPDLKCMQSCTHIIEFLSPRPWFKKLIRIILVVYPHDDVHGLGHVLRVFCLATCIAVIEGADLEVVAAAALLHDIGRLVEKYVNVHHALISANVASELLNAIGFPEHKIDAVKRAILAHSYSLGFTPKSIEECCVSDADKLDALGAIGVYRTIATNILRGNSLNDTIEHFVEKLSKLEHLMCTKTGKKLAQQKQKFINNFFKNLKSETILGEEAYNTIRDLVKSWST
ncbi:MAG TPA: HD domain-containing protein [Pyrodictiaceae archaeon]|nr:HD domain-containing protein [Pyrodictiaceae archaeon]HIQ55255.1 HD domain-containing protein [Pyrodictium sp.]